MDWLLDQLRWDLFFHGGRLRFHLGWMVVNSALAAMPVLLALVLLRPGVRRTPAWWVGAGALVALLPNAAYLLTDLIHLVEDSRAVESDRALLTLYVPAYVAVVAWGFTCYVACLRLARRWWGSLDVRIPWAVVAAVVHLSVAVGVHLGRFARLSSWDPLVRPRATVDAVLALATPAGILGIGALTVAITGCTLAWGAVLDASWSWCRRAAPRAQELLGVSPVGPLTT